MNRTIKICSEHPEYKVPLISTMAFNGAEFWCPYCGVSEKLMGAGEYVPVTEKLLGRLALYEQASETYLRANGKLVCAWFKDKNGNKKSRKDVSAAMLKELYVLAESWILNVKATRFYGGDLILEWPNFECVKCVKFISCPKYEKGICPEWQRVKKIV